MRPPKPTASTQLSGRVSPPLRHLLAWLCAALWVSGQAMAAEPGGPDERLLTEGTVLGEVFCDEDEDGRRAAGERGVGGVRIVTDHGWQAQSDVQGRFHVGRFAPGQHLIKLDETSLPPWATPQGSSKRRLLTTGGLVRTVRFPLTCQFEIATPEGLDVGAKTPTKTGAPLTTVTGRLKPLEIFFDGRPVSPLTADMRIRREGQKATRGLNTSWRPGVIEPSIEFLTRTNLGDQAKGSWRITVSRLVSDGQVPVRVFHGQGKPPRSITWDGTDDTGTRSVVERGALYDVALRVTDGSGQAAVAPPATLGVSYGAESAAIERRILRGDLLSDTEAAV